MDLWLFLDIRYLANMQTKSIFLWVFVYQSIIISTTNIRHYKLRVTSSMSIFQGHHLQILPSQLKTYKRCSSSISVASVCAVSTLSSPHPNPSAK